MGKDLIYRVDCDLALEANELINEAIATSEVDKYYHNKESIKPLMNFAMHLLYHAQQYIKHIPALTTDEYVAFKCPECGNVYIEYDDPQNSFCPTCGIRRKYD